MIPEEKLEKFKPWLISVVMVGSRPVPFIKNSHDNDYIFYVKDNKDLKKCIEIFKLREVYGKNEDWGIETYTDGVKYRWAYAYHYHTPIFGTYKHDYNILENANFIKKYLVENNLDKPLEENRKKKWYHILTTIYILENNSYDLTNEQIENVNICHAHQTTEELYNFIQEKLQEYKNSL